MEGGEGVNGEVGEEGEWEGVASEEGEADWKDEFLDEGDRDRRG